MGNVFGVSLGIAVVIAVLLADTRAGVFVGLAVFAAVLVGSRRAAACGGPPIGTALSACIGGILVILAIVIWAPLLAPIGILVAILTIVRSAKNRAARPPDAGALSTFALNDSEPVKTPSSITPSWHEPGPYTVVLNSSGSNKIGVIKVVREMTGLGLKQTKDLVEAAPSAVLREVSLQEATRASMKLAAVGAKTTLSERKPDAPAQSESPPLPHTDQPTNPGIQPGPFRVVLLSAGANRFEVIKALRGLLGVGLKEAVDMTDQTPTTIVSEVSGERGDRIKEALEPLGATVEVILPSSKPAPQAEAPVGPALAPPVTSTLTPAPDATPAPAPTPTPPSVAPAANTFDLVLTSGGRRTMQVRQALKNQFGLDLLEAFNAVERAPSMIRSGVQRQEAERLKAILEAEGASVEIRPTGKNPSD